MAVTAIAALNSLMREKFYPKVAKTFDTERILLMMLKKISKEEINQRGARLPIRTRRSNSFIGGAESQTMPEPKPGEYKHFTPSLKLAYAAGGFSNLVMMQQSVDTIDAGEFKNMTGMVAQQIKDEQADFELHLDQCAWRDGKGKLTSAITAVATGALGTVTVNPATANYPATEDLIGAEVNFYTSAGVLHNTAAATSTITAVDEATGVITLDFVPTNAAIGDFPVWAGSWDMFSTGLEGLIQNQNITLQGVDVTGRNNLKSTVYDAAGNGFDIKVIDRIKVRTQKREGVSKPTDDFTLITNPVQVNGVKFAGYAASTVIQTSSDRTKTKLDLAYTDVEIGGSKINQA
ncbi:MAG TPA: hypothetical protein VF692_05525, partial [Pyrinomonadaceae bacterium]